MAPLRKLFRELLKKCDLFTIPDIINQIPTKIIEPLEEWRRQPQVKNWLKLIAVIGALISISFATIGLLADLTGLRLLPEISQTGRMTGDFRIAVAGFASSEESHIADDTKESLARGIYELLNQTAHELENDFTISVWGPDRVNPIEGQTMEERATFAANLAEEIDADIVIYGEIEIDNDIWHVTPEFYVGSTNFYEADEITGQYQLGLPFAIEGQGSIASRIKLSQEFNTRIQALALITIGLSFYTVQDFEQALIYFGHAEKLDKWEDVEGRHILYLLTGNAYGKLNNLLLGETYHRRALTIDPEYARAYVGLASIFYIRALEPARASGNLADIDFELLNEAVETYQKALTAAEQPPYSDIVSKVNFGLGQSYLLQKQASNNTSGCSELHAFDMPIEKFRAVIVDYGAASNPRNPRVRELAAESYGRLGLIYALTCQNDKALNAYQTAVSLSVNLERRAEFDSMVTRFEDETIPSDTGD